MSDNIGPKKKSSFSHFMKEAEIVVDDKMILKELLGQDIRSYVTRERILTQCRNMFNDEVHMLFTKYRNANLNDIISSLIEVQKLSEFQDVARVYQELAYKFLYEFSSAQHEANLGLHTSSSMTDTERLFSALDTPKYLKNSFGITISPEMVMFAIGCCSRAVKKWDNIIMIDAMPGTGKTTFSQALLTTMIDIYKIFYNIRVEFDFDKHIIVTETREYCNELINQITQYSILDFIEAGNQFSSKRFYDDDQQDLVNTVERIRFHGLTLILEWNTIDGLDKTIRNRRATAVVSLEERGKAIVRGFNRNPANRGLTPSANKNQIVLTSFEATSLLEQDSLKIYEIPIFTLPSDWEAKVDYRKEHAGKALSKKKRAEKIYIDFLLTITDNQIRITSDEIKSWNIKNFKSLTAKNVASFISRNIGLSSIKSIYESTNISDDNEGIIIIDEVIRSFIKHLKAEQIGAQKFNKENNEVKQ